MGFKATKGPMKSSKMKCGNSTAPQHDSREAKTNPTVKLSANNLT